MLAPLLVLAVLTVAFFIAQLGGSFAQPGFGTVRGLMGITLALPVMLLLLRGTLRELLPQRVRLGRDGLEIRSFLSRPRRIALSAIEQLELERHPPGLRIVERSGAVVMLYGRETDALQELAAALEARRRCAATRPAPLAPLFSAGADPRAWRTRVEQLLRVPETYRDPALDEAALWRIVDHPAAPAEQRVGAVLALRVQSTEAAREVTRRVRIAVDGSVLPGLSQALTRAAKGEVDEGALAQAEAELEPSTTHAYGVSPLDEAHELKR